MLILVNAKGKNMDRKSLFTMPILDSGSQQNLVSASLVKDLGLDLEECPNPYEISNKNREESDQVTHQCTFKFAITKDYIDEVTCDVVLMDCTNVLLGIPFMINRKATITPYLGKCEIEKNGKPFILKLVLVSKLVALISRVEDKQVIQTPRKFVLTTKGKEEKSKKEMDQAYQESFLVGGIRVPIMSMESFLVGRIRVPMFSMDRM
eukprot:Gb_22750 [translate_table: standard]